MHGCEVDGQLMMFLLEPDDEVPAGQPRRKAPPKSWSSLISIPYYHLDLSQNHVDLFGNHYWELLSPWREDGPPLNTGAAPREPVISSLSEILDPAPHSKYYLSRTACLGILRRAKERGKELPPQLEWALMVQAGLVPPSRNTTAAEFKAYHINQRDEGIDLHGISGALMATANMQMQTFITGEPIAFAANQRDEVRDLHDVAGALGAQPGMKQQTFIAEGTLDPWDTQQARIFTPEGKAPMQAGADGCGGRNPAALSFAAGFCAGAAPTAGGIGYQEETSPTLKAAESGTNMVPAILCLNDQGGSFMECTENMTGALRAQEHGHQSIVIDVHGQGSRYKLAGPAAQTVTASFGEGGGNTPLVFENHGIDARYKGPLPTAPTITARSGTGGNNLPIVAGGPCYCIAGNAIDRQPQNGGNGSGYQEDISYTLTATDHHAVFSRQRVDVFKDDDVVSTESARQHKGATDLVYQETVGALTSSDRKGPNSQYVGQDKLVVEGPLLIRRLTPLECERLQGFPDGWTDIPGASDSARYKALGNSVAIPCVEYIMRGITMAVTMA